MNNSKLTLIKKIKIMIKLMQLLKNIDENNILNYILINVNIQEQGQKNFTSAL